MAKTIAGILLFITGLIGLYMTLVLGAAHHSASLFETGAWLIASVGLIAIGLKALKKPAR